jgi:hypothetical protein
MGLKKNVGQNSINIPVQQGGKSSWNRPTDPYIKVDFEWFQTYKACQPSYDHRYIYIVRRKFPLPPEPAGAIPKEGTNLYWVAKLQGALERQYSFLLTLVW